MNKNCIGGKSERLVSGRAQEPAELTLRTRHGRQTACFHSSPSICYFDERSQGAPTVARATKSCCHVSAHDVCSLIFSFKERKLDSLRGIFTCTCNRNHCLLSVSGGGGWLIHEGCRINSKLIEQSNKSGKAYVSNKKNYTRKAEKWEI